MGSFWLLLEVVFSFQDVLIDPFTAVFLGTFEGNSRNFKPDENWWGKNVNLIHFW